MSDEEAPGRTDPKEREDAQVAIYQGAHAPVLISNAPERRSGGPSFVYLATPYWHQREGVRRARAEAAKVITSTLIRRGCIVFCPIAYGLTLQEFHGPALKWKHDEWMAFDAPFISQCAYLLVAHVPGWRRSHGVALEVSYAEKHKVPILQLSGREVAGMIGQSLFNQCDP